MTNRKEMISNTNDKIKNKVTKSIENNKITNLNEVFELENRINSELKKTGIETVRGVKKTLSSLVNSISSRTIKLELKNNEKNIEKYGIAYEEIKKIYENRIDKKKGVRYIHLVTNIKALNAKKMRMFYSYNVNIKVYSGLAGLLDELSKNFRQYRDLLDKFRKDGKREGTEIANQLKQVENRINSIIYNWINSTAIPKLAGELQDEINYFKNIINGTNKKENDIPVFKEMFGLKDTDVKEILENILLYGTTKERKKKYFNKDVKYILSLSRIKNETTPTKIKENKDIYGQFIFQKKEDGDDGYSFEVINKFFKLLKDIDVEVELDGKKYIRKLITDEILKDLYNQVATKLNENQKLFYDVVVGTKEIINNNDKIILENKKNTKGENVLVINNIYKMLINPNMKDDTIKEQILQTIESYSKSVNKFIFKKGNKQIISKIKLEKDNSMVIRYIYIINKGKKEEKKYIIKIDKVELYNNKLKVEGIKINHNQKTYRPENVDKIELKIEENDGILKVNKLIEQLDNNKEGKKLIYLYMGIIIWSKVYEEIINKKYNIIEETTTKKSKKEVKQSVEDMNININDLNSML